MDVIHTALNRARLPIPPCPRASASGGGNPNVQNPKSKTNSNIQICKFSKRMRFENSVI